MHHSVFLSAFWSLILALHVISIVFFIGGGACVILVLYPSLSLLSVKDRQSVYIQTFKRFFRAFSHSLLTMLVSGCLLIVHEGGFAHTSWSTTLMEVIGILVTLWFIQLYRGPYRKVQRALRPDAALFDKIKNQIALMVVLSVVAIVAACWGYS